MKSASTEVFRKIEMLLHSNVVRLGTLGNSELCFAEEEPV